MNVYGYDKSISGLSFVHYKLLIYVNQIFSCKPINEREIKVILFFEMSSLVANAVHVETQNKNIEENGDRIAISLTENQIVVINILPR